jgi:hypothetical protein
LTACCADAAPASSSQSTKLAFDHACTLPKPKTSTWQAATAAITQTADSKVAVSNAITGAACAHRASGNPLPAILHKVIRKSDLGPGRLIIVGDVHGCLNEFFQLLDTLNFKYGYDNLVLTGDLVNKGPRSQEASCVTCSLSEKQQQQQNS